jgi:Zn-dependent M28 family amino/carboxypeptidase
MIARLTVVCLLLQTPTLATIDSRALIQTVRVLASPEMAGRRTGTPGGLKAREWVGERFAAIGLPPAANGAYLMPFRFTARSGEAVDGANVAAICKGTRFDGAAIVLSAHYDHLGTRADQVYPGADDNASGVAVLLEVMKVCRQRAFAHTILFVAFDAEEQGLRGAKAFVASPPMPRERIALNVNLDMVARGDKGEMYVAGTHHYPALKPPLERVAARAPIKLLFGHDRPGTGDDDWTMQSDHGAFHDARIPFLYFGVDDHPDHHKPTDTVEKIDPTFLANTAMVILDALAALDTSLP